MIKDVLHALNYGVCAEVALVLFVFSFTLVLLQAARLSPESSRALSDIPLSDGTEERRR
jgi:hypothetical protein